MQWQQPHKQPALSLGARRVAGPLSAVTTSPVKHSCSMTHPSSNNHAVGAAAAVPATSAAGTAESP